jgi:hypothetical protein
VRAMRWLPQMVALMFFVSARAMACPLCMVVRQLTISAQELVYAEHSVLAMPVADQNEFRVVAVIKGASPPNNTITGPVFRADAAAMQSQKPLLLIRSNDWWSWVNFGPVSAGEIGWLRQLSATKRTTDMTDGEWHEHVAYFLPYLENPEPMVAEIAFNEFVSAPYGSLRSLKPHLDVSMIRAWLSNPMLAARQPVYLLLLGIAGTSQDAQWLEQSTEAARKAHDTTDLAALLGAYLELRGPAGTDQIEKLYLSDPGRTKQEIEAALLALTVHGDTDGAVPRNRVIEAFLLFMKQHPPLAGLVAAQLARWKYWNAVPEYTALLQSGALQDSASRDAIVKYLQSRRDAIIKYLQSRPSSDVKVTSGGAPMR